MGFTYPAAMFSGALPSQVMTEMVEVSKTRVA